MKQEFDKPDKTLKDLFLILCKELKVDVVVKWLNSKLVK